MKKVIFSCFLLTAISFMAAAQTVQKTKTVTPTSSSTTVTTQTKDKVKPTSTIPQKINNALRPKHKKYSGHKRKHKTTK
jgi:hypothetical protein